MTVHDGHEPLGPPFPTELLADLHAGVLPESVADRLWPLVEQDPDALEILERLDAVTSSLGEVGRDHSVATPIPPEIAARIDSALGVDRASTPTAPTSLVDARDRRRTRAWFTVAAASMAAAVGVVFALTSLDRDDPAAPTVVAQPTDGSTPAPTLATLAGDLDGDQVLALVGAGKPAAKDDLGELGKPDVRSGCLLANGIESTRPVLGTRHVNFQGAGAVLMLVAGPQPPTLTAVVVGFGCNANHPELLARTNIG